MKPGEINEESSTPERSKQEIDNKKSFWEIVNSPLCVALASSLIFALIVAWCGAYFQNRNWLQQSRLSSKRVEEEKLFDKRAKIIRDLFYFNKKQSQNLWNLYYSIKRKDGRKADKYKEINQEIISNYNALLEEMKIYFDIKKELKLIQNAKKIIDIWHVVNDKIAKGEATDEFINDESAKVDVCRKAVQEIFYKIMKKTELLVVSSDPLIYAAPSDASPEMSSVRWGNPKEE